ncbi:hypothetical protein BKA69DRAFT_379773 [Paraphysoderma sedebokerense]|nr:hypothetical protein BKA69DRAFT_379773 [Paraphysoderma sedebokerense]
MCLQCLRNLFKFRKDMIPDDPAKNTFLLALVLRSHDFFELAYIADEFVTYLFTSYPLEYFLPCIMNYLNQSWVSSSPLASSFNSTSSPVLNQIENARGESNGVEQWDTMENSDDNGPRHQGGYGDTCGISGLIKFVKLFGERAAEKWVDWREIMFKGINDPKIQIRKITVDLMVDIHSYVGINMIQTLRKEGLLTAGQVKLLEVMIERKTSTGSTNELDAGYHG